MLTIGAYGFIIAVISKWVTHSDLPRLPRRGKDVAIYMRVARFLMEPEVSLFTCTLLQLSLFLLPSKNMSFTAPVELDFLGLHRTAASDHRGTTTSSSIRGMRTSAIASIGTQQLRRVIAGAELPPSAPTMTLFYNGAVATFDDVSRDKAEAIMRMAAEVVSSNKARGHGDTFVGNLAKDMPFTRTRSLQQFLQKRKQRLARVGPYQSDGSASKFFRVKEEAA